MNEKGFTLIEMMIVLLVISILIMITIPNITTQQKVIRGKGCEAYINMVQAQVEAYKMENNTTINPTIAELHTAGFIPSTDCPNGEELLVTGTGEVTIVTAP
jgi:prepilin-type N-terminal cleavage/methylation domain-containing protein